jgi:precorrin-2 dehydrogenase / sirohydrochlorin ferrochelatase
MIGPDTPLPPGPWLSSLPVKTDMTPFYPLFLNLENRLCVVIGAGSVAERKIKGLIAAGASVRVIAPKATKGISRLFAEDHLHLILREYRQGDLEGASLVFAATDNEQVNRLVRDESLSRMIPANFADRPDLCDFILPSVTRKGAITIALSTSGTLPMLAKRLKKEIARKISRDYMAYGRRVATFRKYLLEHMEDPRARRRIMMRVAKADVTITAAMGLREMRKTFIAPEETGSLRRSSRGKR